MRVQSCKSTRADLRSAWTGHAAADERQLSSAVSLQWSFIRHRMTCPLPGEARRTGRLRIGVIRVICGSSGHEAHRHSRLDGLDRYERARCGADASRSRRGRRDRRGDQRRGDGEADPRVPAACGGDGHRRGDGQAARRARWIAGRRSPVSATRACARSLRTPTSTSSCARRQERQRSTRCCARSMRARPSPSRTRKCSSWRAASSWMPRARKASRCYRSTASTTRSISACTAAPAGNCGG